MKVIVIGCTHAGTSAVKSILNETKDVEVTVYERNDNVSFLSCGIALYVGGVVKNAQELFYSNPEELSALGANVFMEHNVTDIDVDSKTVTITNLLTDESFTDTYDKLVLTKDTAVLYENKKSVGEETQLKGSVKGNTITFEDTDDQRLHL